MIAMARANFASDGVDRACERSHSQAIVRKFIGKSLEGAIGFLVVVHAGHDPTALHRLERLIHRVIVRHDMVQA